MAPQIDISGIKGPFIALKTESGDDIFRTICKVTKRSKDAIELLVKNGSYPMMLWVGEDVLLATPKAEPGDLRYEGMEPWRFRLEWQGKMPKGAKDLAAMQEHVAAEVEAVGGHHAPAEELVAS